MATFEVVVSSKAQSDLCECVSFLLRVSEEAASALAEEIYACLGSLSDFPERNPLFPMPKACPLAIRKQVIGKRYIALYAIEGQRIVVYRIIDTRRKFDYLLG